MDTLSIVCVVLGVLILVGRAPMLFAPVAYLRFLEELTSTNQRIRGLAVAFTPFVVALLALPLGDGAVAGLLRFLGLLWAAVTLWMLAIPASYRKLVVAVLEAMSSSGEGGIRMIGVVAVGFGIAVIYFGIYVA